MSFQGFVTPGIVEELYISGDEVIFRNYSVNNTLSLGLTAPVSVKWGVKDNHFFVQTGTGASAIFRVYTLDRAAEGAIYLPGIIPTATLITTLPISTLNVTVCTATFSFQKNATVVSMKELAVDCANVYPVACWVAPGVTGVDFEAQQNDSSIQKVSTFALNAALLNTPNAFGGSGTVSAAMDAEGAVLDGDLNLHVPFILTWNFWKPFTGSDSLAYVGQSYASSDMTDDFLNTTAYDAAPFYDPGTPLTPHLNSFVLQESHSVIVRLGANTITRATLPTTLTRNFAQSGTNLGITFNGIDHIYGRELQTWLSGELRFLAPNSHLNNGTDLGNLGNVGNATNESTLYKTNLSFSPALPPLFETVNEVRNRSQEALLTDGGNQLDTTWSYTRSDRLQRWLPYIVKVLPIPRRSGGPISGALSNVLLHLRLTPTNAVAAWAADVVQNGWILLRGAESGSATTLQPMQANAPTVTVNSFNEKYLLWSIPDHVYRTTLATGGTIEVGTDITKFTSRSLTLINPVYLYSQAETNDDEGEEGHFFSNIESTPLPLTGGGALTKWDMFNPVDDLKHL